MTKGYGVYFGCIYEGGGIISPIYLDKEKAIKACKSEVRKQKKEHLDMFNSSKKNEAEIRFFTNYKWKKIKTVENYWNNSVDCISLQEFDIIP